MNECYKNSPEYLLDEMHRLDLLLNLEIERQKQRSALVKTHEFRGLFLSEHEIESLLAHSATSDQKDETSNSIQFLLSRIKEIENRIALKTEQALKQDIFLPLSQLKSLFQLVPFDIDVLLICLAAELDLKYQKLFAYLQDDITRKKPTVDLALRLHCQSFAEKLQGRRRLISQAPLLKNRLICTDCEQSEKSDSFLSHSLKMDERIVNYLLEIDLVDRNISSFAQLKTAQAHLAALLLPSENKTKLINLFESQIFDSNGNRKASSTVFVFHGAKGVGKKLAAEALCQSLNMPVLITNCQQLIQGEGAVPELLIRLLREAMLQNSAIYLDQTTMPAEKQDQTDLLIPALLRLIDTFPAIIFIGRPQAYQSQNPVEEKRIANLHFPGPDFETRRKLWEQLFQQNGSSQLSASDLREIANKFKFTPGKIQQVFATAQQYARQSRQKMSDISKEMVNLACRTQSKTNLGTLAQKVNPIFSWDDIILPPDTLRHLKEISLHVKHRQQVFTDWNFNGKISLGKGTSALFVGPPGTGKTMAAEIIGNELKLDMYKIDLSSIVSKYIGETEKNLDKIFREAEQSNAILFFDEADALFGKRSEVKDSHDRYANIEINYLLQKMEEYEGMVVLASNFQKNMDEAFTRRLRFIVDIPFPKEPYRLKIWENIFPAETPLNGDIEYNFLAKKFDISGGHIKNIALSAAFMAAENSGQVSMKNIIRATRREFQKIGRLSTKSDFDDYYDLLHY